MMGEALYIAGPRSQEISMQARYSLTAADADKIMQAAKAEAALNKWLVSIAIVDAVGGLLQAYRFDGALAMTAEVAVMKARTCVTVERPSRDIEDFAKQYPS